MHRSRLVLSALAAAFVGAAGACQLLAGLEVVATVDGVADAGVDDRDAAADAADARADAAPADAGHDASAPDPCSPSTAWPTRPPPSVVPGTITFDAALRHAYFGAAALPPALADTLCPTAAFNLDGFDTCHAGANGGAYGPEGAACARDPDDTHTCDIAEGRDNATTLLLSQFEDQIDEEGSWLEAPVGAGEIGMMFRVIGYDGSDEDDAVDVAVMALTGVVSAMPEGKPTWLPDETWGVDSQSCTGSERCKDFTYLGPGFVVGGVLYARLDAVPVPVAAEGQRLTLVARDVLLTGRIVASADGEHFGIDRGRIAGRATMDDLEAQLGNFVISGQPACKSPFISLVCANLREFADLPLEGAALVDGGLPPCRAFSFGLSFSAVPATLGKRVTLPDPGEACPDAGPLCK